jgi:hypothetical protein
MKYYVHNTVRHVENRVKRYAGATHRGLVQYVGDKRVIRGRPLVISEEELQKHLDELKSKYEQGLLMVCSAAGNVIDFGTLKPSKLPPPPPLPNFLPDSVVNDKPSGIPMPIYPEGAIQSTAAMQEAKEEAKSEPSKADEEGDVEYRESSSAHGKGRKGRR